jgi:hypothetical protein
MICAVLARRWADQAEAPAEDAPVLVGDEAKVS